MRYTYFPTLILPPSSNVISRSKSLETLDISVLSGVLNAKSKTSKRK